MAIALKEYRGCRHSSGVWHFCCKHGDVIYPVGRCREGLKPNATIEPCDHKTETEAEKCYEQWEKEQITTGTIYAEDDVLFPSNKTYFAELQAEKKSADEQPHA